MNPPIPCNDCYITIVTYAEQVEWIVLVLRLPTEPSRDRVAVWRELRKGGAIQLGHGSWAVPAKPVFQACVDRVVELVERGPGDVLVLNAEGARDLSATRLETLFGEAREAEWTEFVSDCEKYLAELEREIAKQKFTLAELDEEEQSLDRLRRWHRELTMRDVFGVPTAAVAADRLTASEAGLADYAERVYQALSGE